MDGLDVPLVGVAYSGGRDSTALLHAVLQAALSEPMRVWAFHVNHGLNPHADSWQQQCRAQCEHWAIQGLPVEFVTKRAKGRPRKGDSVEAWAREQRYAALRQMALARDISVVLLAQHQRDQAETFLLQALRSAGVAGLAAMPGTVLRDGITWMRPWLGVPRDAIDAYVLENGLSYVEDDSNTDTRFARNRLRHEVWPALQQAFAQCEPSLAAAATWAQEASACLDELAALDLAKVTGPDGLKLILWSELSDARRSNTLRAWIDAQTGKAPPASLVTRLRAELAAPGGGRWPCADGELRRHRGRLRFVPDTPPTREHTQPERRLNIHRAGTYCLPGWGGRLLVKRTAEAGVPLAWLGHLQLLPRSGGERFQSGPGRPARSLKKQFQSAGLPAWEREGPLLYSGGQLVFVSGLGLDARVLALPGQPQVSLNWLADSP